MRCAACGCAIDEEWAASPLCPACHVVSGASLPHQATGSPLWLWRTPNAQRALATGSLAVILRTYRQATDTTQAELAEALQYDRTFVGFVEQGRRTISDAAALRRVAAHLGLPPHVLGVTDDTDADYKAMIRFGASTIRLASVARQAGRSAEAINELWPLVWRLESRLAAGKTDTSVAQLLGQARVQLGVALGDILPEEALASAARWTGRALRIADLLGDGELLIRALRVHGNELRKIGRGDAAAARLSQAVDLAPPADKGAVLIPLARALAEIGDAPRFDATIVELRRYMDWARETPTVNAFVVREVHLRGLLATGRVEEAVNLTERGSPETAGVAPQWQAIEQVTVAEVLTACGDLPSAEEAILQSISTAELLRLPHQIQRAKRAARRANPELEAAAANALRRLLLSTSTA